MPASLPQLGSCLGAASGQTQRCGSTPRRWLGHMPHLARTLKPGRVAAAFHLPLQQQQRQPVAGSRRKPFSTRTASDSGNGVAATLPLVPDFSDLPAGVEKLGGTNPLVQALAGSKASLAEAQRVREALEAEAQEVAQLAISASESKEKARSDVFATVALIEEATRQQQNWLDKVASLRERLEALQQNGSSAELSALEPEMGMAEEQVTRINTDMLGLRARMEELYANAVSAEAAAAKAEEIATAAMTAAEAAVKDEMQAAAVVKETQAALEKTLSMLKDMSGGMPGGEDGAAAAAAAGAEAAQAAAAAMPAGSSSAAVAAASAAAAAAAVVGAKEVSMSAPASAPAAPQRELTDPSTLYPTGKPAPPPGSWIKWAAAAVGTLAGWWYLNNTDGGRTLVAGATALMEMIKHQLPHIHIHEAERGLLETIVLLFTSIVCVPLVVKGVPGGNAVLGYLLGGAIVGPYALSLISDVHSVKHLAEIGVVLLLFNIGLELSLDRLQSMAKLVFGMGTAQVVFTLLGVAGVAMFAAGLGGPAAIILGGALAMSSTAVAIQVLEERNEMASRHGKAIFSVLLLQDLAVVVLLMLIPLLAPSPDGSIATGMQIAQALGLAAVKAVVSVVGIIAGGRVFVRPLYKKISEFANAEIFAATTLLMVLGTSFLTQLAGLSLALGAFLAGLLIAETEYALQVESDIAPYKGLLMGLFFMSVGMEISAALFIQKWKEVLAALTVLIVGKVGVMAAVGPMFGLSRLAALRSGLYLAPGGEFAFVAFGEAVSRNVLPAGLTNELYLVVALSMALTPYLAEFGSKLGTMLEKNDMRALQPPEGEMKELKDHVIIAGYGRVGQVIAQLLSEQLISFVALDVMSQRVSVGKKKDVPVYFGDAGSAAVLHLVGAERAACAIIALDTPGANYRAVYAMAKHFPHVKTYVRAHDMNNAINLERAGATAVVPETLEPSLQLAAAVLQEMDFSAEEVSSIVDDFRRKHLSELQALSASSGTSLGYGFQAAPPQQLQAGGGNKTDGSGDGSGASAGGAGLTAAVA